MSLAETKHGSSNYDQCRLYKEGTSAPQQLTLEQPYEAKCLKVVLVLRSVAIYRRDHFYTTLVQLFASEILTSRTVNRYKEDVHM